MLPDATRRTRARHPFTIDAMAVLRDHLHEYCYINPLKHGFVDRVRDWPHSSFHRDVRTGLFPDDWAGDVAVVGSHGERE